MEFQAQVATRRSLLLPQSLARFQQVHGGGSVFSPSSLGRQWSFRVERRKLTLLSGRRKYLVDVRAKKSAAGAGSSKVKSKEPEGEEDDEQPAPGTKKLFRLSGTKKLPSKGGNRSKDNKTVFVAGATGKVGRRTVKLFALPVFPDRELVRLGYNVRAGVRNPDNAQFLLEQEEEKEESDDEEAEEQPKKKGLFANFSIDKLFGFLGPKGKTGAGKVELVQCDLEKSVDDIEEALGNAGVVICSIGASEKEVLDVTGPYRIDYKATKSLIDAASRANVNHFILVTSLGTQKFGWPAAVLNLFWGVLYWKARAEKALVESGISFTIVRPGGMERPTDAYKETHNLRLAEADTLFGGQVSNLQVAELMAAVVGNLDLARNKVLEVVAETTAPLRPFEDLLAEISSVDQQTEPVKKRSEISKPTNQASKEQEDEERAASQKRQAEEEKTGALRQKLQQEYEAARLKQEEARQEAEAARAQNAEIVRKTAELRSKLQAADQFAREAKALETALIAAARQGQKLSEREKQEIITSVRRELEAEQKAAEAKQVALQAPKEKPKVEATAKAPVKSKAEVAAEKLAKQEADKKGKQEAEAKAAEEAELAAKAEAEAKAKADAEEARKKRTEAELKAKDEKEKEKLEADRKAEEENKKIDSERRAKEAEEEEMMRIKAERKANEKEEKQAAGTMEAETKPKGFLWPWQKEESEEEAVPLVSSATEETETAEEPQTNELPRPSRPMSPYSQFPSLKPPTPPSYRPAPEADVVKAATTAPKEPEEEEKEKSAVVAEASPEKENKAESGGFRWPWQKPEPEEGPPQEETAAEPLVEETAPINQTTVQEEATTKGTEELPRPSGPLSPYTAFPALKPPTPPRKSNPEEGETEAKLETPKESAPSTESTAASSAGGVVPEVVNSAAAESAQSTSTTEPQKTRPLSPFIMYPSLKPPGPPSPPKSPTKEEAAGATLSEQAQSEESGDSSAPGTVDEVEKVLEPAGAFRWPWEQ